MCEIIITKSGKEIETIKELEEYFDINVDNYKYDYYDELEIDACLCQVNLKKFMSNKSFEKRGGDW